MIFDIYNEYPFPLVSAWWQNIEKFYFLSFQTFAKFSAEANFWL